MLQGCPEHCGEYKIKFLESCASEKHAGSDLLFILPSMLDQLKLFSVDKCAKNYTVNPKVPGPHELLKTYNSC
jgi:hypothetical protein